MTAIDSLAARARDHLAGIPWTTITTESPEQDVTGKLRYTVTLSERMRQISAWSNDVAWTWDVVRSPEGEKAIQAWYGVKNSILTRDSFIATALQVNAAELAGYEAPLMELETYRAFMSQLYSLAMRGYTVHHNALMQYSGAYTPAQIVNNADMTHALMVALQKLYDWGMLKPLKKSTTVGAVPPVIAGIIAVGTIAALIVMAWFVTKMTTIVAQWQITDNICKEALLKPYDEKLVNACQESQAALQQVGKTKGPLDTLAALAGVALLVYAGGLVVGQLQRRK